MRRPEPWQEDSLAMCRPDRRREARRRRHGVRVSLRDYMKRELDLRRPPVVCSGNMNTTKTDWTRPTLTEFQESLLNVAGRASRTLRVVDQEEDGSFLVSCRDTGARFVVSWSWDDEYQKVTPNVSHDYGQFQLAATIREAAVEAFDAVNE